MASRELLNYPDFYRDMLLSIHFLCVYILLGIFLCNSAQCLDTYFSCKINSDIKKMMKSFPNQIYERISAVYDSNIYRALETVQWNSYVDCRNGNICTVYLSLLITSKCIGIWSKIT